MNLDKLNDDELIDLYPKLLDQLKTRGIIRTKNIIGELGEYIAHHRNYPYSKESTTTNAFKLARERSVA